nr:unnamed protein product [Digitaria exilis]
MIRDSEQSLVPGDAVALLLLISADYGGCRHYDSTRESSGAGRIPPPPDEDIAEGVSGNRDLMAGVTQEMEEGCMENDNMANCVNVNDNLVLADENIAEKVHGKEEQTAAGTQEMEEGCTEDDNMTNHVHVSGSVVLADDDIAERVDGNEEASGSTGQNEESCMENEKLNLVADEDIAKNIHENEQDIYISKAKVGKMQCGKCSKVLALSFPALWGPVSISEDYGASYTRGLPPQAGSSLAATQSTAKKVSDSALHRLMGYDSASQLLRHNRVFEDGYESFESMVPVSSRVVEMDDKT